MPVLQFGQHVFAGGVLAGGRARRVGIDLQVVEEDLAQLLGRRGIEVAAAQIADAEFELEQFAVQLAAVGAQLLGVDAHALALHLQQHGDQRLLALGQRAQAAGLLRLAAQQTVKLQGHVRVLGCVVADLIGPQVAHVALLDALLLFADQRRDRDRRVMQILARQMVHAVALGGVQHIVGEHAVVKFAA